MRTGRKLVLMAGICVVTALVMPEGILAEEVGGGETTIHIHVPEAHTLHVQIGIHGALQFNGAKLTGSKSIRVKRLTEPRFEIIADTGYEIETVYYKGKNVTGEIKGHTYTVPEVYEDDSILKVSFKKKAGESGGDSSPDGNKPSGGGDSTGGNGSSGEDVSDNGSSTGGKDPADDASTGESGSSKNDGSSGNNSPSKDNGSTGGSTEAGVKDPSDKSDSAKNDTNGPSEDEWDEATGKNDPSTKDESGEKETGKDRAEERKDEIFDELADIDELLKDETLSAEKKKELEKKRQELLDELVETLAKEEITGKQEINSTLDDIDKLLQRKDLSEAQRKQLLEKKAKLTEQLESAGQIGMTPYILAGALLLLGAGYYYYRKRKASA